MIKLKSPFASFWLFKLSNYFIDPIISKYFMRFPRWKVTNLPIPGWDNFSVDRPSESLMLNYDFPSLHRSSLLSKIQCFLSQGSDGSRGKVKRSLKICTQLLNLLYNFSLWDILIQKVDKFMQFNFRVFFNYKKYIDYSLCVCLNRRVFLCSSKIG